MTLTKTDVQKIEGIVEKALVGMQIPSPEGCAIERERMAQFESAINEHDSFINGNGTLGAKVLFEKIDGRLKTLETFMADVRTLLRWAIVFVGGILVTAIMNLVLRAS